MGKNFSKENTSKPSSLEEQIARAHIKDDLTLPYSYLGEIPDERQQKLDQKNLLPLSLSMQNDLYNIRFDDMVESLLSDSHVDIKYRSITKVVLELLIYVAANAANNNRKNLFYIWDLLSTVSGNDNPITVLNAFVNQMNISSEVKTNLSYYTNVVYLLSSADLWLAIQEILIILEPYRYARICYLVTEESSAQDCKIVFETYTYAKRSADVSKSMAKTVENIIMKTFNEPKTNFDQKEKTNDYKVETPDGHDTAYNKSVHHSNDIQIPEFLKRVRKDENYHKAQENTESEIRMHRDVAKKKNNRLTCRVLVAKDGLITFAPSNTEIM